MTKFTYNNYKHVIPNWFIAFLLVFTIGGYTNYTQPLLPKETVELVIVTKESSTKTITYQKAVFGAKYSEANKFKTSFFDLMSEYHTVLAAIKNKVFDTTISLSVFRKTIPLGRVTYPSEEACFSIA